MHINFTRGEEVFKVADLTNGMITIDIKDIESIAGRIHYMHEEEDVWSPWVPIDFPVGY